MSSSFEASLQVRGAADYADFLLPHLDHNFRLLDVGCGQGTIALGLAETVAYVDAVDPDEEAFADARHHAAEHEITNVEFRVGSVYGLDFPDDHFDACLCHSMLETLDRRSTASRALTSATTAGTRAQRRSTHSQPQASSRQ
jgi:ubiquinone/menaquinone biosynthesis C-methylase UbiE